jgi:RNA polymerase sigma-70 factor (ECF subfamily)
MDRAAARLAQPAPHAGQQLDAESRDWLRSLRATGAVREHLRGNELDEIALEAADDALMSVLARLEDFRGASRFTTWVFKFALLEAAVKLRRRAWQGREVPLEPETWTLFASAGLGPDEEAEQAELLAAVRDAIEEVLTPHQRRVLVALALNGVPIDVLAVRLNTSRGALYKTLHDARRKLRAHLHESLREDDL